MLKLFRKMTGKQVMYVFLLIFFLTCHVVMELTVPDYMSDITKLVNTEGSDIKDILRCGGMMILFSVLAFLASITARFFSSRLAASFSQHLRHLIFTRVESFSM